MDDLENKIIEEASLGYELCKEENWQEGIKHLRFAAERNNLNAMNNLGNALKNLGQYDEAFKWTLRAAELNLPTAMSNLAIMYRYAEGTECNVSEAVKWGKKLIELGCIDAGYSQIVCSYLYAVDKNQCDFKKAFDYALEGANKIMSNNCEPENGDECETVIQLALCYNFGRGTKIDRKEALKYYFYCSDCGLGIASYNAACIQAYPDPEDKELYNMNSAICLFEQAARDEYTDAWYQLALLYGKGEKVKKDILKAKQCLAIAIREGDGVEHYDDAVEFLKYLDPVEAKIVLSGKFSTLVD